MDETVVKFRVGVMVLATILITLILVVLFGEMPTFMQQTYLVRIRFDQAPGVTKDTPVRKSGILIGRVTEVRFDNDGKMLVLARIKSEVPLKANEVARVGGSLIGDATLQILPSGDPRLPTKELDDGEYLPSVHSPDPLQSIAQLQTDMSRAMDATTGTAQDLRTVVQQVGALVDENDERINSVLRRTDETLAVIHEVAEDLREITGDEALKAHVRESVAKVPEILDQAQQTMQRADEAVVVLHRTLENAEAITGNIRERAPALVDHLESSAGKLDVLMDELVMFSQALNSQDTALGQFIHNPELFDRVNRTMENIEDLTVRFRPIVDDIRVFSDKIARHPETVGVRGAIQRRAGIK